MAYGTKKLRGCTYRRMLKRQSRKNQQKNSTLRVLTPEETIAKAEKQKWLEQIEKIVEKKKLADAKASRRLNKRGQGQNRVVLGGQNVNQTKPIVKRNNKKSKAKKARNRSAMDE